MAFETDPDIARNLLWPKLTNYTDGVKDVADIVLMIPETRHPPSPIQNGKFTYFGHQVRIQDELPKGAQAEEIAIGMINITEGRGSSLG